MHNKSNILQYSDMLDKVQRLKIVFVTDIHLNKDAINKLSEWANFHYNTQPKFDYCFIGGDTANCNHDKMDHNQQKMYNETLQVHKSISEIFNCKLFFVPGNHDCKCFFQPNYKVEGFYNMHHRRIDITEGLDLVGFGGSAPGLVQGKQIWSGYPYKNDKQLMNQYLKSDLLNVKNKSDQVILLTHEGPSLSQTTLDRSRHPEPRVDTGSDYLNKFLGREDIVCWLHGHTHKGSKNTLIGGTQILNPGPLKLNQFMYFQLLKQHNRWRVSKKSYQIL